MVRSIRQHTINNQKRCGAAIAWFGSCLSEVGSYVSSFRQIKSYLYLTEDRAPHCHHPPLHVDPTAATKWRIRQPLLPPEHGSTDGNDGGAEPAASPPTLTASMGRSGGEEGRDGWIPIYGFDFFILKFLFFFG